MAQRQTSLGFASDPTATLSTGLVNDRLSPAGTVPMADSNAWDSSAPPEATTSSGVDPLDPYGVGNARKPLIDATKHPLKAIGVLLLNMAQGATGRPLYTDNLRERQKEDMQIGVEKMKLMTTALPQAIDMIKKAPANIRMDLVKGYSATIGRPLGTGFSDLLMKFAQSPDNSGALVSRFGKRGQQMLDLAGGDFDGAMKLLVDDKLQGRFDEEENKKVGSQLLDHLNGIDETLDGTPEYDQIQAVMKDGWTSAEARDPLFQRATGITNDMLDVLDRDKDLQQQLRSTGFIPPSDQKLAAEEKIKNADDRKSVYDKTTGTLRFATPDEIAKDSNLLPAEAEPDKPSKSSFQSMMAVNQKTGEVLDQPVNFDSTTGKYTMADGTPLPSGYTVTKTSVQARSASDLGGLSKGAQAKTETDVITMSDSLANAKVVQQNFKPEYLEIAPNLLVGGLATLERAGMKLSAKQKNQVERFGKYKQDGIQIINEGIKAMTGSAMTESETPRLRKQFADIESDSPTQFKAKIDNYVRKVELAMARRQWFVEHGVTVDFADKEKEPPVSMEGYERMVNDRGPALTEKALSEGVDKLSAEEVAALKIYRGAQRNGGK